MFGNVNYHVKRIHIKPVMAQRTHMMRFYVKCGSSWVSMRWTWVQHQLAPFGEQGQLGNAQTQTQSQNQEQQKAKERAVPAPVWVEEPGAEPLSTWDILLFYPVARDILAAGLTKTCLLFSMFWCWWDVCLHYCSYQHGIWIQWKAAMMWCFGSSDVGPLLNKARWETTNKNLGPVGQVNPHKCRAT